MSGSLLTKLRKVIDPRPFDRGRGPAGTTCASDAILLAMVTLFLGLVVFGFLIGRSVRSDLTFSSSRWSLL